MGRSRFFMKRAIFLALTLFLVISCAEELSVKIKGNSIVITNFSFMYSPFGLDGDFTSLDKEVFKKLKGKSGSYTFVLISNTVDSYGKKKKKSSTLGTINATELSKYENSVYWERKTGGTKKFFK